MLLCTIRCAATVLALCQLAQLDATAQGLSLSLGVAAERGVGAGLTPASGPSFRLTIGGRWPSDLAANVGLHYWRHGSSERQWHLMSLLAGVSQTVGRRSRAWRPVVGGRLEWGVYDRVKDGGEPYGAGELGVEVGLEHRLGRKGAIQILLLPSYLTLVDGPSGLIMGLGLRVTPRAPN